MSPCPRLLHLLPLLASLVSCRSSPCADTDRTSNVHSAKTEVNLHEPTHLLTTPCREEEKGEKTLSQRGNRKNKKMNLEVDLIPSDNSKETDTGGI